MQTSVERLEGNRVRLTVTVPAETVDAAIDAAYKEFSNKLRIPGFRKGRIPRPIIDTHVGREAVLADALERLIDDTYMRALSLEDLHTMEPPDTGELDALQPGQPYTYTAEVAVRPELSLKSIDGLVVYAGPAKTSEREIDAQIEHYRERFATLEPVDRGVQTGDFVDLSFVGTVDGEPYEGNTVDRYLYETGRGLMPEEFERALVGAKAGEKVVAEFEIPETSSVPEFVGKQARFEIDVHEVKAKVLPELDDEFATSVGGFDTLEELREDIRQKLDGAKATGRQKRIEVLALDLISSRLDGEVPEQLIQNRMNSMTREFFETLEERGITLSDYVEATGVTVEQIQADIRRQAELRVREELALEALFRAAGLALTDEDIEQAILGMADGDSEQARRLREQLESAGTLPILKESIRQTKAFEWLMANLEVKDEEPPAEQPAEEKPKKRRAKKEKAADKEGSAE
ncbi:trigger factor [Coriobacteriia bacterium Es71-Z0120]|uniref:trigger factor n=1 Tax=Parvivirga hydrogeniphila TaxID=2939460 RepID=UPI0019CD82C9|nr:trigger factor [Parvivirga hydrogeniphila]MBC7266887.1 trigger factor [Coriobacteriia bacterium]MCL4079267.1 trigger factor [Parvivirga hydrogeniphila]